MKEEKKSGELEPTISDVLGAVQKLADRFDTLETSSQKLTGRFDVLEVSVQDLTEAVQTGFAKVEERLDRIEGVAGQHDGLLVRHEKLLTALVAGQENLTERVNGIDQKLTATQGRVEDVAEMLESMTEVVDENRDMLFKHEGRIAILEKAVV